MMSSQEAGAVVTGNLYLCKKNPLILFFFYSDLLAVQLLIWFSFIYFFHAQHFFVASESSELG